MHVDALSGFQRRFTAMCLINGLLFVRLLVSSHSSHTTNMNAVKADKVASLSLVRRFPRQSQVSPRLAVSIQRQMTNRLFSARQLMQGDVPAFALLSKSLQMELSFELSWPHLEKHMASLEQTATVHPGEWATAHPRRQILWGRPRAPQQACLRECYIALSGLAATRSILVLLRLTVSKRFGAFCAITRAAAACLHVHQAGHAALHDSGDLH